MELRRKQNQRVYRDGAEGGGGGGGVVLPGPVNRCSWAAILTSAMSFAKPSASVAEDPEAAEGLAQGKRMVQCLLVPDELPSVPSESWEPLISRTGMR
mmetsp:Transcript_39891/g.72279  ORF Transcript_39891/g.72279 Transcript_39891/m.72279 type:complete len:98 (-) Transcript_39891:1706-1999(-)